MKWSLTGGYKKENFKMSAEKWPLTRFPAVMISLRSFGILENWSLTGGGCLREMVTHGGSTVSGAITGDGDRN